MACVKRRGPSRGGTGSGLARNASLRFPGHEERIAYYQRRADAYARAMRLQRGDHEPELSDEAIDALIDEVDDGVWNLDVD